MGIFVVTQDETGSSTTPTVLKRYFKTVKAIDRYFSNYLLLTDKSQIYMKFTFIYLVFCIVYHLFWVF